MNNGYVYNPYMQPRYPQMDMQQGQQQMPQNMQQMQNQQSFPVNNKPSVLNGKLVESVDVVKVIDIPMDGSISYYPVADGSAIATKQLLSDGTSKTVIYKPVIEEEKEAPTYATLKDLEDFMDRFDFPELDYLKDDMKELRKEIKDIKIKLKIKEN